MQVLTVHVQDEFVPIFMRFIESLPKGSVKILNSTLKTEINTKDGLNSEIIAKKSDL